MTKCKRITKQLLCKSGLIINMHDIRHARGKRSKGADCDDNRDDVHNKQEVDKSETLCLPQMHNNFNFFSISFNHWIQFIQ